LLNLYLAHSFTCLKKVRAWQLIIEGKYNIELINPFYTNAYESTEELTSIGTKVALDKYQGELSIEMCHNIMNKDLELIRKSDGIIAYFETFTAGTIMEIFAAAYIYRIPVYIISHNHGNHCWLRALTDMCKGKLFKTRKEFKGWLDEQNLRKK
jgi:nucleoside 2-deoxyribosyltransferase